MTTKTSAPWLVLFITTLLALLILSVNLNPLTVRAEDGDDDDSTEIDDRGDDSEEDENDDRRGRFPFLNNRGPGNAEDSFREESRERRELFREQVASRTDMWREHMASRTDAWKERAEDIRERFGDKRAELWEKSRERIGSYIERVVERMNALIERLHIIADRIESRAQKFEERGADISKTEDALGEARLGLDIAADLVGELPNTLDDIWSASTTSSTTFRGAFAELREELQAIKGVFKDVHGHLRDAVVNLKGSATSTPGVSDDSDDEDNDDDTSTTTDVQ